MPVKYPSYLISSSTEKALARKIILLLGLMDASTKTTSVPNIDIVEERMPIMKLRKSIGKGGMPKI